MTRVTTDMLKDTFSYPPIFPSLGRSGLEVLDSDLVSSEADSVGRQGTHHARGEAGEEALHAALCVELAEGRHHSGVLAVGDKVVGLHRCKFAEKEPRRYKHKKKHGELNKSRNKG